jgi:hypothetical protein
MWKSRDSSVGTSDELRAWAQGSIPVIDKILLFSITSGLALGPIHPPIEQAPRALSPGLKQQGHKTDDSLLSSAEMNTWSYTSASPYVFLVRVKKRDTFNVLSTFFWVATSCNSQLVASFWCFILLGLLFNPEYGGDIFFRNVRLSLNYAAIQYVTLHNHSYENLKSGFSFFSRLY